MNKQNELLAGIFLVMALGLFAVSVLTLGRERELFSEQKYFRTVFNDIKGLSVGAPVRLSGISVGRVTSINFEPGVGESHVQIVLGINEKFVDRIRNGTEVGIETQGLLGDRFVSLSPGAGPELVAPGGTLPSHDVADVAAVLDKAGLIVDSTAQIAGSVKDFAKGLNAETGQNLSTAIARLASITDEIAKGKGMAHSLIYDSKEGKEILKNLETTSKNLGSITTEVTKGNGLLHAITYEPSGKETLESLNQASKSIAATATHVGELVSAVNRGPGMMHDLVYNEKTAGFSEILAKLNETAENLKMASAALASGSGTIGALLVDSELYDNLVEVTDGAKRSFLLRQAIKSSLNK